MGDYSSDLQCPSHACKWTCFSRRRKIIKLYCIAYSEVLKPSVNNILSQDYTNLDDQMHKFLYTTMYFTLCRIQYLIIIRHIIQCGDKLSTPTVHLLYITNGDRKYRPYIINSQLKLKSQFTRLGYRHIYIYIYIYLFEKWLPFNYSLYTSKLDLPASLWIKINLNCRLINEQD